MRAVSIAELGEDALVRRLVNRLPLGAEVIEGAGDDCAVVKPLRRGWLQLLKTDCVVEGVHFTHETSRKRAGWKAMARAVSDIAAMGGEPLHALVTLLCPPGRAVREIEQLYAGLKKCATAHGISIVGGETSRAAQLAVVVNITGRVRAAHWVRRDGARPGDLIFVTGRLGGSLAGHHLDFKPRIAEAQWIVRNLRPHAMMDLSDGLAMDLPRMAAAGGVSFELEEEDLPLRKGCSVRQALSDGEDYELLIAISPKTSMRRLAEWADRFPTVPLTCIGRFLPKGKDRAPIWAGGGWDHFRARPR